MRVRVTSVAILVTAATLAATRVSSTTADPVPLPVSAQDTEIKGARVSLVRKASAIMKVTIENRRDSPLVAWEIGLSEPGASFARMTSGSDFSGRKVEPWLTSGPIAPHERRTIDVDLTHSPEVQSASLRLLAFDDGLSEGTAAALDPWRKARQARIDDLRYWSGVFELMPRVSETDLRAYLASRVADRAGQSRVDPSEKRTRLQDVLRRHPSGPDVWPELDQLRAATERELAVLTRQSPAETPAGNGPFTSAVILTQERVASTTFVAAIENLRTVPIEAFGLETVDAGTGRFRSGQWTDFCVVDPGPALSGRHRIQPHEIREMPLGLKGEADAARTLLRLSFVIFDDLVSEGNAAARDEAFRERETRAADYAFAVATLDQAIARPAPELYSFLMDKRVERTKQLQAAGSRADSMALDDLIRQAKESPDRLVASAKDTRERYERVRQRLMRHVAR